MNVTTHEATTLHGDERVRAPMHARMAPYSLGAGLLCALLLLACGDAAAPNDDAGSGGGAGVAGTGGAGGTGGATTTIPDAGEPDAGPIACDPSAFSSPTCRYCDPEDLMACTVCGDDATCEAPTYEDNGDGTVTSSCCGLVWQQSVADVAIDATDVPPCNDSMPPAGCLSWQAAVDYCANLSLAGGGWRLPWVRELKTLAWAVKDGTLDRTAFPGVVQGWYWTPSTYGENHWIVTMSFASAEYVGDKFLRVRCVR